MNCFSSYRHWIVLHLVLKKIINEQWIVFHSVKQICFHKLTYQSSVTVMLMQWTVLHLIEQTVSVSTYKHRQTSLHCTVQDVSYLRNLTQKTLGAVDAWQSIKSDTALEHERFMITTWMLYCFQHIISTLKIADQVKMYHIPNPFPF